MKTIHTSLIIFLSVSISFGQLGEQIGGLQLVREKKYDEISGSPYFFKQWSQGTLSDFRERTFSDLMLRYDTYNDKIEMLKDGQIFELDKNLYTSFSLTAVNDEQGMLQKFTFYLRDSIPSFKNKVFVQVLVKGSIELLRKDRSFFLEENVTSYGSAGQSKSFQRVISYFIKRGSEIKEVKISKASIAQFFPEHKESLKKIKIRSEADLTAFIEQISTK